MVWSTSIIKLFHLPQAQVRGVNEGNVIIISVYGYTHFMINVQIDNSGTLQLSLFFLEIVKYCYSHNAMYDIS